MHNGWSEHLRLCTWLTQDDRLLVKHNIDCEFGVEVDHAGKDRC
ncbi:MAG: hypothetical protein QOH89_2871 [Pseudonocardiales bacterium]|nr:hypothetical protein [Pseudonocardiales bacterium]